VCGMRCSNAGMGACVCDRCVPPMLTHTTNTPWILPRAHPAKTKMKLAWTYVVGSKRTFRARPWARPCRSQTAPRTCPPCWLALPPCFPGHRTLPVIRRVFEVTGHRIGHVCVLGMQEAFGVHTRGVGHRNRTALSIDVKPWHVPIHLIG
jgi:hypothetical protein